MKNKLTVFTQFLLDLMFYGGIVVTATVPLAFRIYGNYNSHFREFYWELVLLFLLSGFFAVMIIRYLRKIFSTVLKDDCFVYENVQSLRKM